MADRYIRHRLSADAQRAYDQLSDAEIAALLEGALGNDRRRSARDQNPVIRRAANLRDGGDLLPTRDNNTPRQINPSNFVDRHRDPREYPWNPSNPNFSRNLEPEPIHDEDPDEAEHAGIRREMVKKLKDAHEPTWRFMKERLSPEDFDALKRLILAEPDLDRPASDQPYDFGGMPVIGGTQTPLASDEASSLPGSVFRALAAARHVRPDDNICRQDGRATKRSRVVSLAFDGDEIARGIARIAPGASRIRLG